MLNEYPTLDYEPLFSAYDFMCLFCAIYANEKIYFFNYEDLINYIKTCKINNLFPNLLNNINEENLSSSIEEAIQKLRIARLLYTIAPEKNHIIYLFPNTTSFNLISKREAYLNEMLKFISMYHCYLSTKEEQTRI